MVELVVRRASGRLDDLRAGAIGAIRGGPTGILPVVLSVMLTAAAVAVLILTIEPAGGDQPVLNQWVRGVAAGIFALAGLGLLLLLRSTETDGARREPRASDEGVVTGLLSLAVLFCLLLVPVYFLAARTHPTTVHWIGYGFFDKRWLPTTFMIGTLGAMAILVAVAQLVRGARSEPDSWREWASAAFASPSVPASGVEISSIRLSRVVAMAVAGIALAAFFFAPPWHPSLTPVNIHETPMMAGVQGIANGATPYIGSGAVQYGPGSEIIHYLYLHAFGFNLESFRQSTVLLYWLAATIFFAVLFIRLPWKLALITSLVAILLFPTLQMVSFQPNGSVGASIDRLHGSPIGVWGWPNAMRYIGVFAVAMLYPAVAAMTSRRSAQIAGIGLGLFFGLSCFISQENLIGGAIAIAALALLLSVTQTLTARMVVRALVTTGLGFAVVAVIVFAFYAAHGELGRFLQLYYLIPPAVAAGYSDTVYYGGFGGAWGHLYFLLPFFLGVLCVLSVIRIHPPGVARAWSRERIVLVSALVATCVSFAGAFLRSDSSHLVNTMLALPVALVLAVAYLPGLLGLESVRRRVLAGAALAAVPLALLPVAQITNLPGRVTWPLERFSYHSQEIQWQRAAPDSVAAKRLGPVLHEPEQWCCTYFRYPVSMREFAAILNRLHAVVGDRRVYVANFIDGMEPGAAYFLADLNPAPSYLEPFTMAMNQHLLDQFLGYYRAHLSDVGAVVAVYPNLPEVRMFEAAYPNYRRTEIPFTWGSITVLTRS
jgi:hypothetical protein